MKKWENAEIRSLELSSTEFSLSLIWKWIGSYSGYGNISVRVGPNPCPPNPCPPIPCPPEDTPCIPEVDKLS